MTANKWESIREEVQRYAFKDTVDEEYDEVLRLIGQSSSAVFEVLRTRARLKLMSLARKRGWKDKKRAQMQIEITIGDESLKSTAREAVETTFQLKAICPRCGAPMTSEGKGNEFRVSCHNCGYRFTLRPTVTINMPTKKSKRNYD